MEALDERMADLNEILDGDNPRTVVKDAAFKELMESIKEFGVLEPILVRPRQNSGYEIIAGHRRAAAARAAGLAEIPVRCFDIEADLAERIRVVENRHRENPNPIQEAQAIQKVRARVGDIRTVAALVNMSVAAVTRSLALLDLPMTVQVLIMGGQLTAEHGHQIMRADEKSRTRLVEFVAAKNPWTKTFPTVSELKREIEKNVENDLKKAPFPKGEPYADMVACSACPMNSANQSMLFDGATAGICTGPACYSKKERQFYKDFAETHGKKLEAYKFMGTVSERGYMPVEQVKGNMILTEELLESKPIKKAMVEKPEAFGWVVIKPGSDGTKKKPSIGFCLLDTTVLPKDKRPEKRKSSEDWQAEYKKERFFNAYRSYNLLEAADDLFDARRPSLAHLVWIARAASQNDYSRLNTCLVIMGHAAEDVKTEKAVDAILGKMGREDIHRLIWLGTMNRGDIEELMSDGLKVNIKPILKKADGIAAAEWEKELAKQKEIDTTGVKK
jgi:ParB/RepB/Spo0J family partition protein